MHRLKITNSKNHIEEITLKDGFHTIGRSLDSTLRLESNEVSRLHARLLIGHSNCEIIDEDSTNGTFVNGNRIASHRLINGDKIQIGRFKLEFSSERAHHHPEDTTKKGRRIIWSLLITALILISLIIYQKTSWKKTWLKSQIGLAKTTSHYLAEKNKEALYLGEYTFLNLTDLSPQIIQAAIIDRHGKIRAYQPHTTEPIIDTQIDSSKSIRRDKYTLEIYTPIYYDSIRVGTLWMLYKIK